ncbi:UvrD-helicase domain-containing protein [Ornithobacterium rhinotracheale]|uniref:UvrD-helicase domain-containing protein n=1 Tax=Ornithobacterium rhinotracheale TaxID=28251 RepID=UPI0040374358
MLQAGEFKIYSASAGTGKTYTLVQEIMHLLLQKKNSKSFSQILAITFTNKAANEMKERILQKLDEWRNGKISEPELASIQEHLNISKEEIQERSGAVLSDILHNYSLFSVSTIDTFNLRLMRAFATDLGLSSNFDVELDTSQLMGEAVDLLYADLQNNQHLSKIITQAATENLARDKSWDISEELKSNASHLYADHFLEYMREIGRLELKDLVEFRGKLITEINEIQDFFTEKCTEILNLVEEQNLAPKDFSGGSRGILSFFTKILNGKMDFPTKTHNDILEGRKLGSSSASASAVDRIEEIFPKIEEAVEQIKAKIVRLQVCNAVYGSINTMSLYNEIEKNLSQIESEGNVMLISEFNKIINENLQSQPTPFIYEKIGTKYRHYFIDEFQDTSSIQWSNLQPLVENALAQGDTLMLVGDPKQSIYRFRGGNPDLMIGLINQGNEFYGNVSVENLDKNWRSYHEIIEFNNDFYTFVANKFIQNEGFKNIYIQGNEQKINHKKGGYVCIKRITIEKGDTKNYNDYVLEDLLAKMKNCLAKGYELRDLTVLVNTNKEANRIAEFLQENEIAVLSDEALLLINNPEIQLILSVLRLTTDTENHKFRADLLLNLKSMKKLNVLDFTEFSLHVLRVPFYQFIAELAKVSVDLSHLNQKMNSLYDQTEKTIAALGIESQNQEYVLNFLDEILKFQTQNESSAQAFIAYWDERGDRKSIAVPSGVNAVKIMTIHKSKGLQFPVVFLPYTKLDIKDHGLWIPLKEGKFNHFYVNKTNPLKGVVEHLPDEMANIVQKDVQESEMDQINKFYVATTRAEEQLYMYIKTQKKYDSFSFSEILDEYMNSKVGTAEAEYCVGEPEKVSPKKEYKSEDNTVFYPLKYNDWKEKVRISSEHSKMWDVRQRELQDYGKKIHAVLERIQYKEEVEAVLNDYERNGFIDQKEKQVLQSQIHQLLTKPELKEAYEHHTVLNERDFISKTGKIFRPDRLVKTEKGWYLIDYKTGEKSEKHILQIQEYKQFLSELKVDVAHAYLVYLSKDTEILEVD